MHFARTKLPLFLVALAAIFVSAFASADDWTHTGTGIRVKTVIVDINVYEISHYIKGSLPAKTKQAAIDADIHKKFVWTMKRDVDKEKIQNALKDAFSMNGYTDAGKIGSFIGAFKADLKEKQKVTIVYNADKKETTVTVEGGGTATLAGADFMKGTWSIWFGKIDQPKLGDQLISKL